MVVNSCLIPQGCSGTSTQYGVLMQPHQIRLWFMIKLGQCNKSLDSHWLISQQANAQPLSYYSYASIHKGQTRFSVDMPDLDLCQISALCRSSKYFSTAMAWLLQKNNVNLNWIDQTSRQLYMRVCSCLTDALQKITWKYIQNAARLQ